MKTNTDKFLSSPVTWILLVVLSVSGIIYIYFNYGKANSIIHLDITMDRRLALDEAKTIAGKLKLGPDNYKQAAAFITDSHFQNFAELEGGGIDSVVSCSEKGIYMPFVWKVRHFREHDAREVAFFFTPAGKTYGFSEKLPESEKGASLPAEEAQKIAEQNAVAEWGVDLAPFNLVEKSKEAVISGRIDHSFVYERKDARLGKSNYRLKLVVSGDKLTTVYNFVKIPEEFDRRYSEMRSANDTISSIASAVMALIYGLAGVAFGLFFMARKKWIVWKMPVIWGMSITFASVFLITLNNLPLAWFSYDTASSQSSFLLRQILSGLAIAAGFGLIISLSAMAGEGLGRMAFPRHIQLWKNWERKTASTLTVLGHTILGYLFAIILVAIDIMFYVFTTKHLGWWSPAGTLTDPNILATYLPWLDSIATSLQAGFWEELLFRAVPIAGVYFLVRNRKSQIFWIIAILLIQTIVFGAGHANYANQPSYARIIEMIVPFTIMGIIYIFFGILPAIIAHFTADVFWISLPLWVSRSQGIWADRIMVLLLLFVPLWIVLYSRFMNKKWEDVPEDSLNGAWKPSTKIIAGSLVEKPTELLNIRDFSKLLIPLGIIGLAAWIIFTPFHSDSKKLKTTRQQAIEITNKKVTERYKINPADWKILSMVNNSVDFRDVFAWREGGKKIYDELLGKYLPQPDWTIRFVKTRGKAEDRAEEFTVRLSDNEKTLKLVHKIPESIPGKTLIREQVQIIADSTLLSDFSLQRINLKEVMVSPKKLENRTDWEFMYADTTNFPLKTGQGRYRIVISGGEVTESFSYLFVPEDWSRKYTEEQNKQQIFKNTGRFLLIGIILFGLIWGIIRWTRKKFSVRVFLFFPMLILLITGIDAVNSWNDSIAGYSTQIPFSMYMTQLLIGLVISTVFLSLTSGIIAGSSIHLISPVKIPGSKNLLYATCLGLFISGILSLSGSLAPKLKPDWFPLDGLNSYVPFLGFGLSGISGLIIFPAFGIVLFRGIDLITAGWTRKKIAGLLLFIGAGLVVMIIGYTDFILWLVSGIATGLLMLAIYFYFLRTHFEWLPVSFGIPVIIKIIPVMIYNPFPGAIPAGLLFIFLSAAIIYYWYHQLICFKKGPDSVNN